MKHRPTEIPYIPKAKRRSRFAPREGGAILSSNKGIEALRRTSDRARRGRGPRGGKKNSWLPLAIFGGVFAYSIVNGFFDDEPADSDLPPVVRTEVLPPPVTPSVDGFGDVRGLFSADDYPVASLRREEEGTVRVRLAINAQGRPTGCEVVQSSGFERLDKVTCRLLVDRARFDPSPDGAASEFTTPPIRWEIPR